MYMVVKKRGDGGVEKKGLDLRAICSTWHDIFRCWF